MGPLLLWRCKIRKATVHSVSQPLYVLDFKKCTYGFGLNLKTHGLFADDELTSPRSHLCPLYWAPGHGLSPCSLEASAHLLDRHISATQTQTISVFKLHLTEKKISLREEVGVEER